MKRVLLLLPFVVAACASDMTAPSESFVKAGKSMSAKGDVPMCTIGGTEYPRGVNDNGYNYCARIFIGPADGVDGTLDGTVSGDPTYAKDHLVMKWNAAWDACNAVKVGDPGREAACTGAWTNNEWNGKVPGGSGEVWVYKMKWIGPCTSTTFTDGGGYCIWGEYEVLLSQGTVANQHFWDAHAKPAGYGN